jgi:hypothetical protein
MHNIIQQLYLLPPQPQPPEAFKRAYRGLSSKLQGSALPWHLTMPEKAYKSFQGHLEIYERELSGLDLSYYNDTYLPTGKVFEYLKPAKINKTKYEQYCLVDSTGHIRSFEPDKNGFAARVEYDRVATLTGRLKTVAGPTLLHLPKVYRGVLESRWSNAGAIVSFDYKSLEPRVLLSTCGTQPIEGEEDIYSTIKEQLFAKNPEVNREVVKRIVLSELYGASIDSLRQRIPNVQDLEEAVEQISGWFQLKSLRSRLTEEWNGTGNRWITNYYGRRVKTETAHTLINHYVQSTAVDVALLGFLNILSYLEELGRLEDVVPLFVLHDALIFDVNENAFGLIKGLAKVGARDIKNLEEQTFYMSVDKNFIGTV